MKLFNIFKVDIKRSILSYKFIFATLLSCALYFLSGYNEFIYYAPQAQNIDVLHFFRFLNSVGTFEVMLVLCCVIPYTSSFCSDWNSKYICSIRIRTSTDKYSVSRVVSCAISGGLAIAMGILLFILILSFKYPLVDINGGMFQSYIMELEYNTEYQSCLLPLLVNENYIAFYALSIYLIFLFGAFWSVVGLCISALIPNIFVALCSPFILYFLQGILLKNVPNQYNASYITKGDFNIGAGVVGNMIFVTFYMSVLIAIFGAIFTCIVKRRIYDEFH